MRSDLKSECITRESAICMAASLYRVGHVSVRSDGHKSLVSQSYILNNYLASSIPPIRLFSSSRPASSVKRRK